MAKNTMKVYTALKMHDEQRTQQESLANAKGTRDSSACIKAHCEQM